VKHVHLVPTVLLVAAASLHPTAALSQQRQAVARTCSSDVVPAAERRRLQTEYSRRLMRDGRRDADEWAAEQGRQFRTGLEREGICKPRDETRSAASSERLRSGPKGEDGKPCTKTRVENRAVASLNGGPMTMGMVVVCDDRGRP
jgi:hypothetical protein